MKKQKIKSPKAKKRRIPESELPASVLKKRKRKKRTIKFFISLFIIITIGITAFFMGWVHTKLQPKEVAVVTNRIKKSVEFYDADQFIWEWSGLIPGNIRIDIYDLSDHSFNIQKEGVLPSGEFYARFIEKGKSGDFNYVIDCDLIYQIKKSSLLSLIEKDLFFPIDSKELVLDPSSPTESNSPKTSASDATEESTVSREDSELTKEDKTAKKARVKAEKAAAKELAQINRAKAELQEVKDALETNRSFFKRFETTCSSQIYSYLTEKSSDEQFVKKLGLDLSEIEQEIIQFVSKNHPDIEVTALVVNEISIPNYNLYEEIKQLVSEELKPAANSPLAREITASESSRTINENRIKALTELGKVLSDYPILMDYLKIYSESDKDLDLLELP